MKKIYLSVFLYLLTFHSFGQFPSLSQHTVTSPSHVQFKFGPIGSIDILKTEIPPPVLGGGWRSYFIVDGINTYVWSTPKSFIDNSSINFASDATGPVLVSYPQTNISTAAVNNWKRNYHSVYSIQYMNHPTQGPASVGIMHGENKNISSNCTSGNIMNTINPNTLISCSNDWTWSGGNPYHDGWLAYHALVSVAWYPNNQSTNWGQHEFSNHLGPVSWPANSFIAPDNRIATAGHSHPSSIIANGYMYIFYLDAGPFANHIVHEEGRLRGIKLLRVLTSEAFDPSKYEVYYKDPGGNVTWNKSLPVGFTKENMLSYVRVKGPKSTDVLNVDPNVNGITRFSVAKVRNTNYFIGVEEYIDDTDPCANPNDGKKYKIALRFSSDLMNWTDRQIHVITPSCWNQHQMRYPIFLDRTGWTNTEVDLNDFYILGAGVDGSGNFLKGVNKIRVYDPSRPPRREVLSDTLSNIANRDINFESIKGLDEEQGRENISVYPNPASGTVNLNFRNYKQANIQIAIFDMNGRKVMEIANAGVVRQGSSVSQIDVSKLNKGAYFLKVTTGSKSHYTKLIVN